MKVSVRRYAPEDAAALANVMWRSVRIAAWADYRVAQTEAWLPARRSAEEMHRWASDGRTVLVATSEDGQIVGYVDLEADGHIDHLSWLHDDAMSKVLKPPGAPGPSSRPEWGAGRP